MKKYKPFPRMMALFLAMVMLLGMIPGSVFAKEVSADTTPAATESLAATLPASSEPDPAEGREPTAPAELPEGESGIVTAKGGADVWESPAEKGTPIAHLSMGAKISVVETKTVQEVLWGKILEGWIPMDSISLAVESPTETPSEAPTEAPTEIPTEASTEAPTEVPTETPTVPSTEPPVDSKDVLTAPVALDTTTEYFEDFFALLHAAQNGMEYHFLTSSAEFRNPQIHAYSFEVEPDLEAIGFEIKLTGVDYYDDPVVGPSGQLEIRIPGRFLDSDPDAIQVFDVSSDSWMPLTLDSFSVSDETAVIRLWIPNINSRFAIVEGFPEAAMLDAYYGETLGSSTQMNCNNKTAWCVSGRNPYGFGNSKTGTFALHLVHKPSTDSSGRTTGYSDYVAGGCLEYWKKEPTINEGQIVNATYAGYIGGWSDLSVAQRRQIVSYMLYGVRYLSDWSFTNSGSATINSTNPVVNMIYAQQILVWSAVKGIDPYDALSYYGQSVPYYGEKILNLAANNPEGYDYDKTLMMVGEGGSRQDLVVVLKPIKKEPPKGDITVDKTVTGSNLKSGWVMELYDSYSNAASGYYPIATAKTNSSGRAKFTGLKPGQTYYVREAPASRQQNNLDSWTLSNQILSATVEGGVSTSAGTIKNTYSPNYPFTLQKVPKCSDTVKQQLQGNKMYSLAGAKYKVSLNGQQQEILTTDASGKAVSSQKYPVGTILQIQEIEAPPGYKLSKDVVTIEIIKGTNTFEVSDEPVFDPPFSITKVDKSTSAPQGDGSFTGAVFRWEYYDNSTWAGTPKRTWYFRTGSNGRAYFDSSYLAPGYQSDPLYVDNHGTPDIPLGTITMTEIQNSLGYTVLPQPLRCSIVEDPNAPMGAKHVFSPESMKFIMDISSGNVDIYEPIDEELFGSFRLDKVDSQTGSEAQGNMDLSAKFQIVNNSVNAVQIDGFSTAAPGQVCYEFTTDADGHFSCGKIFPLGKYTITEVEAPNGYLLNTEWSQSFTVSADMLEFDFTVASDKACSDDPDFIGSFDMDKLDMITGNAPQGDATLEGAEFEIINNSLHPIYVQEAWNVPNSGTVAAPGEVLFTFKTDSSGHYHFEGLPVGSYYIQEKTPPEGYEWDHIWQYDFDITTDAPHITVDAELTCQNYVKRGSLEVIKEDSLHPGNTTQQAPLDGITFSVTNESKHPVVIEDVTYNPGEVVTTLAIAWDGSRWSAKSEVNLPYGTYGVTENEMHPGMANDYYRLNAEKHLVEIRESAVTVSISHVNEMVEGKIVIHKVDPLGNPLSDAKFGLEWSEDDGQTWNPVVKTEVLTKGGCTDPNLVDGTLTTGEDGLITFSGLYPTLRYRVTELEAPDGYVLLRDTAYNDMLPEYERVYTMTVHNSPGFTFPTTGSNSLIFLTVTGATMISMSLLCFFFLLCRCKEKKEKAV